MPLPIKKAKAYFISKTTELSFARLTSNQTTKLFGPLVAELPAGLLRYRSILCIDINNENTKILGMNNKFI